MLKKIIAFLISWMLFLVLLLPASAQTLPRVVDTAGLLSPEEIVLLEEKSAELYDLYGIHAVILTVDSLGGVRPQDFADDYYDQAGYGADGVLYLLAMEERAWYISTCGNLIYALTDYGIQEVGELVLPYLSEELWYDGFFGFLDALPDYLDAFEASAPIDGYAEYSGDYYHGDQEEIVYYEEEFTPWFGLSLFCGIIAASVSLLIMRISMNSKRPQRCASVYLADGSWNLTQHRDLFLYSKVTKTRKQEPPKSTGGGSSVHRSSGGRSHGGGGGRF